MVFVRTYSSKTWLFKFPVPSNVYIITLWKLPSAAPPVHLSAVFPTLQRSAIVPTVLNIFSVISLWKRKLCWVFDRKSQTTQFQEAHIITHIPPPEVVCLGFLTENQVGCHLLRRSRAQTFQVYFDPTPSMVLFDLVGLLFFLCQLLPDTLDLLGHPKSIKNHWKRQSVWPSHDGSWHQMHGQSPGSAIGWTSIRLVFLHCRQHQKVLPVPIARTIQIQTSEGLSVWFETELCPGAHWDDSDV